MDDDLTQNDVTEVTLPSRTYKVVNNRIVGMIDGLDAMQQAVNKILSTERFVHSIYTENYGNDLPDLVGKNYDYIKTDIKRIVSEALLADDRITDVEITNITKQANRITIYGIAHTIFGAVNIESEVENN